VFTLVNDFLGTSHSIVSSDYEKPGVAYSVSPEKTASQQRSLQDRKISAASRLSAKNVSLYVAFLTPRIDHDAFQRVGVIQRKRGTVLEAVFNIMYERKAFEGNVKEKHFRVHF
jgi:hypothetical protein